MDPFIVEYILSGFERYGSTAVVELKSAKQSKKSLRRQNLRTKRLSRSSRASSPAEVEGELKRREAQSLSNIADNIFKEAESLSARKLYLQALMKYDVAICNANQVETAWIECEAAHKTIGGRQWGQRLKNKYEKKAIDGRLSFKQLLFDFQSGIAANNDFESARTIALCQTLAAIIQWSIKIFDNQSTSVIVSALSESVAPICLWLKKQQDWAMERPGEVLLEQEEYIPKVRIASEPVQRDSIGRDEQLGSASATAGASIEPLDVYQEELLQRLGFSPAEAVAFGKCRLQEQQTVASAEPGAKNFGEELLKQLGFNFVEAGTFGEYRQEQLEQLGFDSIEVRAFCEQRQEQLAQKGQSLPEAMVERFGDYRQELLEQLGFDSSEAFLMATEYQNRLLNRLGYSSEVAVNMAKIFGEERRQRPSLSVVSNYYCDTKQDLLERYGYSAAEADDMAERFCLKVERQQSFLVDELQQYFLSDERQQSSLLAKRFAEFRQQLLEKLGFSSIDSADMTISFRQKLLVQQEDSSFIEKRFEEYLRALKRTQSIDSPSAMAKLLEGFGRELKERLHSTNYEIEQMPASSLEDILIQQGTFPADPLFIKRRFDQFRHQLLNRLNLAILEVQDYLYQHQQELQGAFYSDSPFDQYLQQTQKRLGALSSDSAYMATIVQEFRQELQELPKLTSLENREMSEALSQNKQKILEREMIFLADSMQVSRRLHLTLHEARKLQDNLDPNLRRLLVPFPSDPLFLSRHFDEYLQQIQKRLGFLSSDSASMAMRVQEVRLEQQGNKKMHESLRQYHQEQEQLGRDGFYAVDAFFIKRRFDKFRQELLDRLDLTFRDARATQDYLAQNRQELPELQVASSVNSIFTVKRTNEFVQKLQNQLYSTISEAAAMPESLSQYEQEQEQLGRGRVFAAEPFFVERLHELLARLDSTILTANVAPDYLDQYRQELIEQQEAFTADSVITVKPFGEFRQVLLKRLGFTIHEASAMAKPFDEYRQYLFRNESDAVVKTIQRSIVKRNALQLIQVLIVTISETNEIESTVEAMADQILLHMNGKEFNVNLLDRDEVLVKPELVSRKLDLYLVKLQILRPSLSYLETLQKLFIDFDGQGLAGNYEFDLLFQACGGTTSPVFCQQWNLIDPSKGIKPPDCLFHYNNPYITVNSNTNPVIVAVLDSGIQQSNADLTDVVLPAYHPNIENPRNEDTDKIRFHGTHCAGIIAAQNQRDVGIGVVGIAGNVKKKVQLFPCIVIDLCMKASSSDLIKCITESINMGAKILNCSFCCSHLTSQPNNFLCNNLRRAFLLASSKGIISVLAAGNKGFDNDKIITYPCAFAKDRGQNMIVVAATDEEGNFANNQNWTSNYGSTTVHICAPGVSITSCGETQDAPRTMDGTSMAAPHVSGCLALMMLKYPQVKIEDSSDYAHKIVAKLLKAADKSELLRHRVKDGRSLNLSKALDGNLG